MANHSVQCAQCADCRMCSVQSVEWEECAECTLCTMCSLQNVHCAQCAVCWVCSVLWSIPVPLYGVPVRLSLHPGRVTAWTRTHLATPIPPTGGKATPHSTRGHTTKNLHNNFCVKLTYNFWHRNPLVSLKTPPMLVWSYPWVTFWVVVGVELQLVQII